MTPEDIQDMVESAWEKTWDNLYTNLTLKYVKKKKHGNLRNSNQKL